MYSRTSTRLTCKFKTVYQVSTLRKLLANDIKAYRQNVKVYGDYSAPASFALGSVYASVNGLIAVVSVLTEHKIKNDWSV